MKTARFEILVGIIIAGASLGARGLACGPCGGSNTQVTAVLPPTDGSDGGVDAGVDAGDFLGEACLRLCPTGDCAPTTIATPGGEVPAIECTTAFSCGAGRRPAGLLPAAPPAGDPTAAWLARMAYLEAAAIDAFRLLRRDLAAHGAPRRLLRACSRAGRDERRHARTMTALARRRGARVEVPRAEVGPPPALEALATQNAVEGCVREAFGAVVARFQAGAAADRALGAALQRIAREEAQHAALSFQIDAWARARLTPAARSRVDRARAAAAAELLAGAAEPVPAALVRAAGHPDQATLGRLARATVTALGLA
jgi:hypothetical protein